MVSIRLVNATKKFRKVIALPNVNLEIKDKEFMVLVGPSGCGKSTTLNIIAGLEYLTEGRIFFNNDDVTLLPPKDRNVAMVFQSYALYPHINVRDNMGFGLKLAHMSKQEIDQRIRMASQILGIEELLLRKPKELSGGQRQRVALGRAIVREPTVFLFDEPLSNLDAKLRVQMRAEIIKLHEQLQTTLVYVTHDQVEAMSMADRITIMNKGIIQQVGTPKDVYNNPMNLFVAGFIGSPSMNILKCKVKSNNLLAIGPIVYPIANEIYDHIIGTDDLLLGIRPEHINVVMSPEENNYEAIISVVEFLGADTLLSLTITDEISIMVLEEGHFDGKSGQKIYISWSNDKIHLFDAKTEKNLLYKEK